VSVTGGPTLRPTGSARELLALDAADPVVELHRHPLWEAVFQGRLPADGLVELAVTFYPSLAGTARYLFSSKVSTLAREDGKTVFRDLYDALTVPDADADRGWRQLAEALGATAGQLEDSLAPPPPEVCDYVAVARGFGHRSAHEAVGAAWGVERQLPVVWERLADALVGHYRVAEPAVRYLRYHGSVAAGVEGRIMGLVDRYLDDPWKTYEARRAARECAWAWKSIAERVWTRTRPAEGR
jgi:pyrroloquinoline quinone (PQQ) biosynthesis protein C